MAETWAERGEIVDTPGEPGPLPPAPPAPEEPPVATQLPTKPAAELHSLVPDHAVLGSPNFTLHVHGVNFAHDSVILWNGSPEPTVFVSTVELTTNVNMDTAEVAITIPVEVRTGELVSNTLSFMLEAPAEQGSPASRRTSPRGY